VELVACRGCDLLQRVPVLPPGGKARCGRCGQQLAQRAADPLDRPLALCLAAAIAFVAANVFPLMGLSAEGRTAATTLVGGVLEMWAQGSTVTAAVVAFCAVLAPAACIASLLAILVMVRRPPAPRWVGTVMRLLDRLRPWAMNEVLLLGMLVALTKIAQLATVEPGVGLYAMGAVVLLLPLVMSTFDAEEVWRRVRWVETQAAPAGSGG